MSNDNSVLTTGDYVLWHVPGAENLPPARVRVASIEIENQEGSKRGDRVDSVEWNTTETVLLDLDNGRWAYLNQVKPAA